MGIESLKQQARNHEQNAEWQSAIDHYSEVLAELTGDGHVDIGLHHRMGDLYVRVGGLAEALEHYEEAVELYREAFLPNNAIAVCRKIIRHVPQHHGAYLLIGRIRGEQGFLPEARENFLTYADRVASDGDAGESVRALKEYCDLAPNDVDIRVMLAEQMVAQGREEEAEEQLRVALRHYEHVGDAQQAGDMEARIVAISRNAVQEASPEPQDTSEQDDFVDLGAMILGGMAEKSTRFTVLYEEPTGDEQADFARVLAQFKDKVSENLENNDVRAHHDLGTAYKEMGLLDEAIGSFQAALRASADHLPTYEMLGQTFLEMGRPEAAVKSMERAFEVATAREEELTGIYYYLGLAYTQLNSRQTVME